VREHRLCGFEVLLRWDHPTRGTLHAQSFVNEANESGLIVQLGRWVLRESCRQLADWAGAYPGCAEVGVSVNLCDRELLDPEFARFVTRTLEETGVPASRLTLEMSEGAITNRFEAIVPVLEQLRGMGVQLQLDGFGSGRSSLGMLRRLPITAIKIDREVIRDVARDEERRALAATIINYATALGLGVTAEGVETQAQVRALATLGGCRYVQGHLFSSPVPAPEAEALLDEAPVA